MNLVPPPKLSFPSFYFNRHRSLLLSCIMFLITFLFIFTHFAQKVKASVLLQSSTLRCGHTLPLIFKGETEASNWENILDAFTLSRSTSYFQETTKILTLKKQKKNVMSINIINIGLAVVAQWDGEYNWNKNECTFKYPQHFTCR